MEEIYTEKCVVCNGKGKKQKFDKTLKRWVPSSSVCDDCGGVGEKKYIIDTTGFVKRKIYINR